MDRKAWIIVIICLAGMGVNWWYAMKNTEAAKKVAETKLAEAETAQKTLPAAAPAQPAETAAPTATTTAAQPAGPEEKHTLVKGNVSYEITTRGGGIAHAVLAGTDRVTLNARGKEPIGALRREATGLDAIAYQMVEKDASHVILQGVASDGIQVRKEFRLTDGMAADDHLLDLTVTLTNTGTTPFKSEEIYLYAGAAASERPDEIVHPAFFWNDAGNADYKETRYFGGGWFSSEKTEFRQGFAALRFGGVMDRFYANILTSTADPDQPGKLWARRFLVDHSQDEFKDTKAGANDFAIEGAVGLPPVDLAPGASQKLDYEIYLGPKEYKRLAEIGRQRHFVMFYGWFTIISRALNNVMRWMHDLTGNWGVAIILLTILVRLVLWPIHAKSQSTMKRMQLLSPKLKELQEKYKDDQQKQSAEMMKLYREYGVNPVGGCLPMFLQIPIFFGFYRVLQYAAELRGQDFLWVKDLSMPDTVMHLFGYPLNPLPLIMGVTMILQMKLTPQPQATDKMQQRIFMLMPFFFLFICYSFASALALYWSTQNLFSIFQSRIMKLYQKDPVLEKTKPVPKGPPPQNPFFNPMGQKHEKKGKNRPPKLGG